MTNSPDDLPWLLENASGVQRDTLRRVILALRLLRDDARRPDARRVPPTWARARRELEAVERRARLQALDGALRALFEVLRPADSFLWAPAPATTYAGAWRALFGTSGLEVSPPLPSEPPRSVIERLLASARRVGAAEAWARVWELSFEHLRTPERAVEIWRTALGRARSEPTSPRLRARCQAGLVAALLENFQAREAFETSESDPMLLHDPWLRRVSGWSALALGEVVRARERLANLPPAFLPRPLAELREDVPIWRELLLGATRTDGAPLGCDRLPGVRLVAWFVRHPSGRLEWLDDLSRGHTRSLAQRLLEWRPLRELRGDPASDVQRYRRVGDGPWPGLCEGALAVAQVPVWEGGECLGWLHLECTHYLLPSATALHRLGDAHAEALRLRRAREVCTVQSHVAYLPLDTTTQGPMAEFHRGLFAACPAPRGGWAAWVEVEGTTWRCSAARGCLAEGRTALGAGGFVARALRERRPTRHAGESEERLHPAALVGLAVPLIDAPADIALGVLVLESLESARVSVLPDVALLSTALETLRVRWWSCSFRAHHETSTGRDLAWDPERSWLASLEPSVRALTQSGAPLLVLGPRGAGRRTLARWIHLRATRQTPAGLTAPCIVNLAECEGPEAFAGLKDSASGPRWFLIAEGSREELRHHPAVPASLAAALDPLPIVVPPLRERRVEIPALVSVLARNVARRLGLPALALSDEAMASLWRQRWNENVRELKAVVRHLTLAYPGREVVGVEVLTVLRARGLEALERLPTRRATRLDIEQALESTRHGSGSWNLSRAARYLGWDPATLSSRLRGREKK